MAEVQAGLPLDPDIERTGVAGGAFPAGVRRRWPRLDPRVLAVVFAGGVAGGVLRYAVGRGWPVPPGRFPWPTLGINTAGAFALSLLVVLAGGLWAPRRYLRPLLGTGFIGAFTTFSSVMADAAQLTAHGHPALATAYVSATLLAGLNAATLGLLLGRMIVTARRQ